MHGGACRDARCDDMATWPCARGPGGLADRANAMLALVGDGFGELVELRACRFRPYLPWSSLPRDVVTADLMVGGTIVVCDLLDPAGLDLSSSIRLRCDACARSFRQSWVFERGYERWVVTEPPAQPAVM